jgi:hypothetical protein
VSVIWDLLSGLVPNLWGYVAAAGAAVLGILGVYFKGRKDAKTKAENKAMKEDIKAHDRINQADLGIGATDGQRIDRLRDFAAKHGNGQTKGPSGGVR